MSYKNQKRQTEPTRSYDLTHNNQDMILLAESVKCLQCLEIIPTWKITDWESSDTGYTGICPVCRETRLVPI